MKHSKQILSITSAAVDALSNTRDVHKEKRAELQQAASSIPREDIMQPVSLRHQNPPSPSSSTSEDRVSDCVNGGLKDQTSSSPFELSFNGTQRVRVPSRLLREIKSPLERSSSSSDSKETPGVISIGKIGSGFMPPGEGGYYLKYSIRVSATGYWPIRPELILVSVPLSDVEYSISTTPSMGC